MGLIRVQIREREKGKRREGEEKRRERKAYIGEQLLQLLF